MNEIDAVKKEKLLESLDYIRNFIETIPTQTSCAICLHWNHREETCKSAGGLKPPAHIQKDGCPTWVVWDTIPFQ